MTINNIKTLFESIADNHFQIKSFGFGKVQEIEGVDSAQYVRMWVVPGSSTILDNTIERTFTILIFDLVHKDDSNQTEVLSDTEQILDDVVRILKYDNDNYTITNQPTLNPFTERFGDDTTGYSADIVIESDHLQSTCDIPMDEYLEYVTNACNGIQEARLTCSTLVDCPTIIAIEDELADHETRIEALEAGGGGLDCADVAACQVIIDIQDSINNLATVATTGDYNDLINLPIITTPTLANVLAQDNKTGQQDITSDNALSILSLYDAITTLSFNTNAINIDNTETRINHSNHLHLDAPTVFLNQGYMKSDNAKSNLGLNAAVSSLTFEDGSVLTGIANNINKSEVAYFDGLVYSYSRIELAALTLLHPTLVNIETPIAKITNGSNYIEFRPQGTSGEAEIKFTRNSLLLETNNGEYNLKRTTAGGILLYTNGRIFNLSATVGGAPNMSISTAGYVGINTTTPTSELEVNGTIKTFNAESNGTISANNISSSGTVTLSGQTASRVLATNASKEVQSIILTKSIGLTLDGQGGVISTGSKGFSLPSFNGTILSWHLKGDDATTGSIVIDIKRGGTSIVGAGNKPTITSANSASANVSGWTSTTITAGDEIEYNVDSASTFVRVNLEIKIQVNI